MQNKNIYVCPVGHKTVTIDLVEGTTPMMLRCRQRHADGKHNCTEMASSKWYRLTPEEELLEPEYEWYKPETLKGLSVHEKEHVRLGGLLLRKRSQQF